MQKEQRLFIVGAVMGTLLDLIHVQSGVLYYASPFYPGGQAFWVPLLFGAAALVLVRGYRSFAEFLGVRDPIASTNSLTEAALGFVAAYAATGLFHEHELLLTAALVVSWAWHQKRHPGEGGVPYAVGLAIAGSFFEAALSSTGAFSYTSPDLLGVPVWLFALYLHASILTRAIALRYFGGARL